MEYYTSDEVYKELIETKGSKSNGLKFEDFIVGKLIYIDSVGVKVLLSKKPLKRTSDNPLISGLGIYTGWKRYLLKDSTITDFSNELDEIEVKYFFGNKKTIELGVDSNIFLPLDKLTSNRHFVYIFCIKNGNVQLYNIFCTVKDDNGLPIGYINPTYYKEVKFIIAINNGFVYYNLTDDLTESVKKCSPDLVLSPVNCYPTLWDEDLYVLDNGGVKYPIDLLVLNNKIKPIVYIPPSKFKTVYIEKINTAHLKFRSEIELEEPLDFDKDEDYYIDWDKYAERRGLKK